MSGCNKKNGRKIFQRLKILCLFLNDNKETKIIQLERQKAKNRWKVWYESIKNTFERLNNYLQNLDPQNVIVVDED